MEAYIRKLDAYLADLQAQEKALAEKNCLDESNFLKIRINIVNVCKTVCQVMWKTEAEEKRAEAYLQKLSSFSRSWQEAREKAEKYGREDQAMIESIKLDTLQTARNMFEEMKE